MEREYQALLDNINQLIDHVNANNKLMDGIRDLLKDILPEEDKAKFKAELDALQEENDELQKDIAMLEELVRKIEMERQEDERSSSPYEPRYDSWDEVFTGGDY